MLGRGSVLPIDMSRPSRLESTYIILVDVHNLHAYFFYPWWCHIIYNKYERGYYTTVWIPMVILFEKEDLHT